MSDVPGKEKKKLNGNSKITQSKVSLLALAVASALSTFKFFKSLTRRTSEKALNSKKGLAVPSGPIDSVSAASLMIRGGKDEKEPSSVLPTLADLKAPTYENSVEDKQLFQVIIKAISSAEKGSIQALRQVCVEMQSPETKTMAPQERLFKIDQALKACEKSKHKDMTVIREKLGQYKKMIVEKLMGNPRSMIMLIDHYTDIKTNSPDYTLLLSNLPSETLERLHATLTDKLGARGAKELISYHYTHADPGKGANHEQATRKIENLNTLLREVEKVAPALKGAPPPSLFSRP